MQRKEFLQKAICLLMTPTLNVISSRLYAMPKEDDIPMYGRWPKGGESYNRLATTNLVVATIESNTLYITGASCGSPVAVSVNAIGFVYHDVFADSDANNIMIDLSSAPSGVYSLHITNLLGGYLDGTFNL